ncbi:Fruiting body protein SC1 [Leucoagaricus sp. SymC.cos]|nr:Fruiting body protein SC1 [Leucoagaricus sp. SymC.cos]
MYAKLVALSTFITLAAAGGYGSYGNGDHDHHGQPKPTPTPTPTPTPGPNPGKGSSTCSTGPVQCCNQVQDNDHSAVKQVVNSLSLIGAVVPIGSVAGQVGLTCSPVTVIGAQGNQCNAQTVCCSNNSFNGVIALGCTPININL